MKKMTLIRSIATVGLFLVAGMGAFAQVALPTYNITTPGDTSSSADTVSVNAVMPYFVRPDAAIKSSPLYNASGFKWTVGVGASLNTGSLTVTAIGGAGTYYLDTMVVGTFTSIGNFTISTTERSSPKFAPTGGCDGNTRNLTINVIALPTVPTIANADTAQGGCGISPSYTVKFDFSGSSAKFPIYVGYTIKAYDINNNSIGSTYTHTYYKINGPSDYIVIPKAQLDNASGGTDVNGKYVIRLGQMWDRISARATNRNAANVVVDASAVKASIMVLPAPNTGIIKHIKTL